MRLLQKIRSNVKNIPGWRTNRKIVVIESDDWGSIRMPSRPVYEKLCKAGVDLISGDCARYSQYDSLATEDDLMHLFETLSSVKDSNGNHCVFTAISVVANPDFEKIKETDFQEYHYEPFTETLKRYPNCDNSFEYWKEGIEKNIFVPQFHGREHLNVTLWLKLLRAGNTQTLMAFDCGMWGIILQHTGNTVISFQAAFDLEDPNELIYQELVVSEGLRLFKLLFGYQATFFVPPNGPFNRQLERSAAEHGIRFMSASKIQHEPLGRGCSKRVFHWLGQRNQYGQRYITRNCFFEPNQQVGKNWVDACLNDIRSAFLWRKPAIISSHRVNYIGAIDPMNRYRGMDQLKKLLTSIINMWPEVEFLTSVQLAEMITSECV